MSGPLSGIRVVDLTTIAMGPLATQILGDMGADVIKVEPPQGDQFRMAPPYRHAGMGAGFLNLNRNKRSVVLDLKCREGRDEMLRLLATADVFVSNVRFEAMRTLGLDYESLSATHPRLIHCVMYGFSEQGPYAGRPAYDDIIQATSGVAALQGRVRDGAPTYVNMLIADKTVGLAGTYAVAMALFERERSGCGQAIEVPMFETMVAFNFVEHLAGETFVPARGGIGYDRVLSTNRGPYKTRDGYLALLPYTTAHWNSVFERAGKPEYIKDARFADTQSRTQRIDEIYALLAELVAERTTAEWLELLADADVPMTPIRTPEDLLSDPHLDAIGFFGQLEHPTEGDVRTLGIPIRFSRTPGAVRRLAPSLGEHTDEVLLELDATMNDCGDSRKTSQ